MSVKGIEEYFQRKGWVLANDGLPENPLADPKCELCKGHGVVDTGNMFGCIIEDCECVKKRKG